jgi:hypothetical protein
MSIVGSAVESGTTPVFSGGTTQSLNSIGGSPDKRTCFMESVDFFDQTLCTFTSRVPKVNGASPSGWTQARRELLIKRPLVLPSGELVYNKIMTQIAVDVNTPSVDLVTLLEYAGQMTIQSDFRGFWSTGSTE